MCVCVATSAYAFMQQISLLTALPLGRAFSQLTAKHFVLRNPIIIRTLMHVQQQHHQANSMNI